MTTSIGPFLLPTRNLGAYFEAYPAVVIAYLA